MVAIGPDAARSRFPGLHTCRERVSRSRRSARRARTPVCGQRPTISGGIAGSAECHTSYRVGLISWRTRRTSRWCGVGLFDHCRAPHQCGNVSVEHPRCGFGFDRGNSPSGAELIIDGLGNFHRNSMSRAELCARADAVDQFKSPLFKCGQGAYRPSADCRRTFDDSHDPAAHESSDKR
jgi:hypothetical protein